MFTHKMYLQCTCVYTRTRLQYTINVGVDSVSIMGCSL